MRCPWILQIGVVDFAQARTSDKVHFSRILPWELLFVRSVFGHSKFKFFPTLLLFLPRIFLFHRLLSNLQFSFVRAGYSGLSGNTVSGAFNTSHLIVRYEGLKCAL